MTKVIHEDGGIPIQFPENDVFNVRHWAIAIRSGWSGFKTTGLFCLHNSNNHYLRVQSAARAARTFSTLSALNFALRYARSLWGICCGATPSQVVWYRPCDKVVISPPKVHRKRSQKARNPFSLGGQTPMVLHALRALMQCCPSPDQVATALYLVAVHFNFIWLYFNSTDL